MQNNALQWPYRLAMQCCRFQAANLDVGRGPWFADLSRRCARDPTQAFCSLSGFSRWPASPPMEVRQLTSVLTSPSILVVVDGEPRFADFFRQRGRAAPISLRVVRSVIVDVLITGGCFSTGFSKHSKRLASLQLGSNDGHDSWAAIPS